MRKTIRLKYLCYILDDHRKPISTEKRNQNADILYDYYGASGVIDKIDGYTIDDHVMLIGEDGANLVLRNLPLMYEVNGKAWINNHAHVLKPKENVDFDYLFFALESADIFPFVTGSAQPKLNQENLKLIPIPIADYEAQVRTAILIKNKCVEIDALSSDIQTQIDTLEQYKRSVISEAVTRGLDPNVPMKDSGITWVKQIPKHWAVIPSKYLFHNSDTRKYPGDEQLTASQRHGIITQREYMERENAKVVFATQGLDNWKHIKPNDFVISLRSFQGGLEMSETTGCITWHYVVLEASKPIYPPFYKWLFKSVQYINALQGTCNFIRDGQDLRFSNFSKVPLYEPPMDEQKAIADYLDAKCAEIDQTIAQKQEQLDTLADYKKSLIYEYVTGKKEVPAP